jgi:hypothetical protein
MGVSMKVYHLVPDAMRGHVLYPLSRLKSLHPDIYNSENRKYDGREKTREIYIKPLRCYWGDVVFLSPVPTKLIQERQRMKGERPLRFYEIETDDLDQKNLAVGLFRFEPFKPDEKHTRPYPKFEGAFEEALRTGNHPPFLFLGLPHVVYKGEIDISHCHIVE